jgi:hypothetical protein
MGTNMAPGPRPGSDAQPFLAGLFSTAGKSLSLSPNAASRPHSTVRQHPAATGET